MKVLSNPDTRSFARIAGALYLTIAVSGGFAIAYVPYALTVSGDPVATMNTIAASSSLYLAGIAGDVVMMLAEVALTVMLFFMFRHVSPVVSAIAALARLSMVSVMSAMLFFSAAALALATTPTLLSTFAGEQRAEIVDLFLYMDHIGVWIWQIFFALHLILLGTLVAKSGAYPRVLGWGMTVGGFGYLVDSMHKLAMPDVALVGAVATVLLIIVTFAEIGFALWLIFKGPRTVKSSTNQPVSA